MSLSKIAIHQSSGIIMLAVGASAWPQPSANTCQTFFVSTFEGYLSFSKTGYYKYARSAASAAAWWQRMHALSALRLSI